MLLPGGGRLKVSNLAKAFWPKLKLTKGDLFRHYVRGAACMLSVLADRPLVMKRYPNSVDAKPFYQHRAPSTLPVGVRVDDAVSTTETRPSGRRSARHAALLGAARVDLAGPVVLENRIGGHARPRGD